MVKEAMLPRDGNRGREDSKDGVFTPILALSRMMGKIFLSHPHPLGPTKPRPTPFRKTLLLVNFPTIIAIMYIFRPLKIQVV